MNLDWYVGLGGTAIALIGFVIGAVRWRVLERGQRLATTFLGASTLADLVIYLSASRLGNVQPIVRIWFVVSGVIALETLAVYQYDASRARAMRWIAVAYVVISVLLALTVDPVEGYSTMAGPLQGLVLLAGGVLTLLRRVARARKDLADDPGFLLAVAFGAMGIVNAFQTVITSVWIVTNPVLSMWYYAISNFVSALAALIIIQLIRSGASAEEKPA